MARSELRLTGSRRVAVMVGRIPRDELGGYAWLGEGPTSVGRLDPRDRVILPLARIGVEGILSPRHVNRTVARDGDVAELASVHRLRDLLRVGKRLPAVGRTREENSVVGPTGGETCPAHVHVAVVGAVGPAVDFHLHLVVKDTEEDRARGPARYEARELVVG